MIPTRRAALDAWLERNHAQMLWQEDVKRSINSFTLQCYLINGRVLMVQDMGEHGWELYVPSSDKNSVEASLDGAAVALGCQGCRGLI